MVDKRGRRVFAYRSRRGLLLRTQYRARVEAANGKILWVTGESYNNREDLMERISADFPLLKLVDHTQLK